MAKYQLSAVIPAQRGKSGVWYFPLYDNLLGLLWAELEWNDVFLALVAEVKAFCSAKEEGTLSCGVAGCTVRHWYSIYKRLNLKLIADEIYFVNLPIILLLTQQNEWIFIIIFSFQELIIESAKKCSEIFPRFSILLNMASL